MKILLAMILSLIITIPIAYAQGMITFDVDTDSLIPGEIVELTGTVQADLIGKPVAVEIKDGDGNVILIRTVTSDANGNFSLKFKVPSSAKSGSFDIVTNVEVEGEAVSESNTESVVSQKADFDPQSSGTTEKGGGCLIATATYGSELAPQVQMLREIRDNSLLQTQSGTTFMTGFNQFYYSFSPYIADYERENPVFKEAVKLVITPLISSLSILNYVDMNSEETVLGYGISLILLNVGMYFGVPILAILRIKKIL